MKVYVVVEDSGLGDGLLRGVLLVTTDKEAAEKLQARHEHSFFIEEHEVEVVPKVLGELYLKRIESALQ